MKGVRGKGRKKDRDRTIQLSQNKHSGRKSLKGAKEGLRSSSWPAPAEKEVKANVHEDRKATE